VHDWLLSLGRVSTGSLRDALEARPCQRESLSPRGCRPNELRLSIRSHKAEPDVVEFCARRVENIGTASPFHQHLSIGQHDSREARASDIEVARAAPDSGRLIRTRSDQGIIVILDNRIVTKTYGRAFLRALPQCPIEIL
jgi:hypothetical protein